MRWILIAAAVYDVLWGASIGIFPDVWFRAAGMPHTPYPELWHRFGTIVAVYGIGYAIAASDPLRHWPIVAIGFLGKVLGPFAFFRAVSAGHMSLQALWIVIANDLIWWAPFAWILSAAWQNHAERRRSASPAVLGLAMRARTNQASTLEQLSHRQPVLLVFLRPGGCPFCREALSDLAARRSAIERTGACIVIAHMYSEEAGVRLAEKFGLITLPRIADPARALYRAFGLPKGGVLHVLGPKVWFRFLQSAIWGGHGFGAIPEGYFQMPGLFLLYHGEIIRSYRHQSVADRPDYVRFVTEDSPRQLLS